MKKNPKKYNTVKKTSSHAQKKQGQSSYENHYEQASLINNNERLSERNNRSTVSNNHEGNNDTYLNRFLWRPLTSIAGFLTCSKSD